MRSVMFTIHAILIYGIYILLALIKTKDSNKGPAKSTPIFKKWNIFL